MDVMSIKVKIVSALPGTGKSKHLLEKINSEPDKNYIWITPFLDEAGDDDTKKVGRVREATPDLCFVTPSNKSLGTKKKHLEMLLYRGENVSMTHNLFMDITKGMVKNIEKNNYHIIIDETIDKVSVHTRDDKMLDLMLGFIELGVVKVGDMGVLSWVGRNFEWLQEERELCDSGMLFLHNGKLLIKRYNSLVYSAAESVTVLTYMFHASPMRAWMDICKIPYEYLPIPLIHHPQDCKNTLKELLTLEPRDPEISKLQENLPTAFSSSWYKKNSDKLYVLRDVADKIYKRCCKRAERRGQPTPRFMYTTFKDYWEDVAGVGCKAKDFEECSSNFIAKNSRATNKHGDKTHILYWVNTYPQVDVARYLNELLPEHLQLSSDEYALSEMIQFIYRSALRNGKPTTLYIASDRMRDLFVRWLDQPEKAP